MEGIELVKHLSVEDTHVFPNYVRLPVAFREISKLFWISAHLIVSLQQNNGNVEIMKRYNLFLMLLLAVMFAACSNDDSPVVRGMHPKKPYATPELMENIIAVLKQYK